MAMKSMKLTPEEQKQEASPMLGTEDGDYEADVYPYDLRMHLCDETLKKLGITELPPLGTTLMLMAKVEIVSISEDQRKNMKTGEADEDKSLSLQITDMDLAPAPSEMSSDQMATSLYGG